MAVVIDSFLITYEAQPNGKIKMLQFCFAAYAGL